MSDPAAPSSSQVFNPRLVFGLVAAGVLAFIALLLLIAYGGSFAQHRTGRGHVLSVAAVGFKGLADLVGNFQAKIARPKPQNVRKHP